MERARPAKVPARPRIYVRRASAFIARSRPASVIGYMRPSMMRSTFWMEVAFSEVPVGGRRLTTGIFRDVTRRVEDEEHIRQMNEQLEARVELHRRRALL